MGDKGEKQGKGTGGGDGERIRPTGEMRGQLGMVVCLIFENSMFMRLGLKSSAQNTSCWSSTLKCGLT